VSRIGSKIVFEEDNTTYSLQGVMVSKRASIVGE
jgi:hypothetical protein